MTNAVAATPPWTPLYIEATPGNNQVSLFWNSSTGATSYNVKRATVSGGAYTTIASSATNYYTNSPANNGTTYYYVVSAVNSNGESPNSREVSATPSATPQAPTHLSAAAGGDYIGLGWWASTGATSYSVKRATVSGGPYTTIAGSVTDTSYIDKSLSNGATYYYVVSAANSAGSGQNSTQASANYTIPVPLGFTATPGNTQVLLSWDWNSNNSGIPLYNVKRATISGGPYTTIASFASSATNTFYYGNTRATIYSDNSVSNGITYYYVVSVVNTIGQGTNSAQASAIPSATSLIPPTGLSATAGNGTVALSWTASTGATSYNVLRSTYLGGLQSTPYIGITNLLTTTTYNDNSVTNFNTYSYMVRSVNAGGQSTNSNWTIATPSTLPQTPPTAPPTGVSATAGNGQVSLSWTASTGATQYSIFRATVSGGPYSRVGLNIGNTSTTYTDASLSNGTTYYYVINAYGLLSGGSMLSAQVSATPTAP